MRRFLLFYSVLQVTMGFAGSLPVRGIACEGQVTRLLDSWSNTQNWKLEGGSETGNIYLSPTTKVGTWLKATVTRDHRIILAKRGPNQITQVTWDYASCLPHSATEPITYDVQKLKERFSDASLQEILDQGGSGIIYAWSPHMPLSMAGMKEIRDASRKLGLRLTIVLDPHADPALVKNSAKKLRLSRAALRRIESYELFNRHMCMHFPSVLLYQEGKMVGPVYAGFKPSQKYRTFIEEHLAGVTH